jgi:hypothetical protein
MPAVNGILCGYLNEPPVQHWYGLPATLVFTFGIYSAALLFMENKPYTRKKAMPNQTDFMFCPLIVRFQRLETSRTVLATSVPSILIGPKSGECKEFTDPTFRLKLCKFDGMWTTFDGVPPALNHMKIMAIPAWSATDREGFRPASNLRSNNGSDAVWESRLLQSCVAPVGFCPH